MRILGSYMKKNLGWIAVDACGLILAFLIIALNKLPLSEWVYAVVLNLFLMLVIGGINYVKYYRKHKKLKYLQKIIGVSTDNLEKPEDILEEDYQELLHILEELRNREINELKQSRKDMMEYYTMWIHQIKTPIAAMRLLLQSDDTAEYQELTEELFQIEQYVEMALGYMRLNAGVTDFVFRQFSLDEIAREAVRKYARIFIRKKISLDYRELKTTILTDDKWLEFVIEQLLSNALKYTKTGTISIYMQQECMDSHTDMNSARMKTEYCRQTTNCLNIKKFLIIEDTGIGIRSEDLPRVCEKGYTGYNGHTNKRSTGIGLYLCKQILNKLGHTIEIQSEVGKGTRVILGLSEHVD